MEIIQVAKKESISLNIAIVFIMLIYSKEQMWNAYLKFEL